MFIYVKMSSIVGTLICISMINATSESLNARKIFIFQHFSFYEELKCYAVEHKKGFITSGAEC